MSSTKKFKQNKKRALAETPEINIINSIDLSTVTGETTEDNKKSNKTLKSVFSSLLKHDGKVPKDLKACFNGGVVVDLKPNKQDKSVSNKLTTNKANTVGTARVTLKGFIRGNISIDKSTTDKSKGYLKIESCSNAGEGGDNYAREKEKSITTKNPQSKLSKPFKKEEFSNKESKSFGSKSIKSSTSITDGACVVCGHIPGNKPSPNNSPNKTPKNSPNNSPNKTPKNSPNKTPNNLSNKKTKHNSKRLLKGNEKTCKVGGDFFENNSKPDSKSTKAIKGVSHLPLKVSTGSGNKLKNKTSDYLGTGKNKKNKKKTTPGLLPQDNNLINENLKNNHKSQTQDNLTPNKVKKNTTKSITNVANVAGITNPISRRNVSHTNLKTSVSSTISTVEKRRSYVSRTALSKSSLKRPLVGYRKEASAPTVINNCNTTSYNQAWSNLFKKATKVGLRVRHISPSRPLSIYKGGWKTNVCPFKFSVIDKLKSVNEPLTAVLPNRVPFFQSSSPDKKLRGWLYPDSFDWATKKQSTMVSFSRGPMARKKQSIVTLKDRDLLLTAPLCYKVSETILLGNSNRPYFVFGGESSPSSAPSTYSALVDLSTLV